MALWIRCCWCVGAVGIPLLWLLVATAQSSDEPQPGAADRPPARAPEGPGRRPPPPLEMALDRNQDRVISAEEIANAVAALKTLDKNNDGKLTEDEYRPAGPPPPPPPQGDRPEERPRRQRPGDDQSR